MKRCAIVLLAAQDAAPLVNLQQSIDAALANGDDSRILQENLDVARAQHALKVSKNSFTLAASAGYGQAWTFGEPIASVPVAAAEP
jgi:hypothetical protein